VKLWDLCRIVVACFLSALLVFPSQNATAQSHIVTPSELHQRVVSASQMRQRNIEKIDRFFSSAVAQKALKEHGINATRVKAAVAQLSDDELAKIAARTEKVQKDFAAGAITDHLLILIVIAIAVVLIAILAAKL
jgi:alcohol dehydrogenase YqhD (iron-dependent ADH family)